jgi:CHAD domain-containing protein
VHDARKRLKKTRALVRLARPALPKPVFRDTNRALRDRGRALSGARDADVLVATVEGLADAAAGRLPAASFTSLRDTLAQRADAHRRASADAPADDADALRSLAREIEELPFGRVRAKHLARALTRTYANGRAEFARADREPSTERLHEWRKRVKDLWYQQKLVQEAWPAVLKAQAAEAKTLSQLLGDEHDLAVLAETVERDPELTSAAAADRDAILELIAHRRQALLAEVRSLGRRVYAEKPQTYDRRTRRYLKAALAEAPSAAPAALTG